MNEHVTYHEASSEREIHVYRLYHEQYPMYYLSFTEDVDNTLEDFKMNIRRGYSNTISSYFAGCITKQLHIEVLATVPLVRLAKSCLKKLLDNIDQKKKIITIKNERIGMNSDPMDPRHRHYRTCHADGVYGSISITQCANFISNKRAAGLSNEVIFRFLRSNKGIKYINHAAAAMLQK